MKSGTVWFTLFATVICILNISGFDDKNILLFLTSPPFWLLETAWFSSHIIHPTSLPQSVLYMMTVSFWFILGRLFDRLVDSAKTHKK